MFELLMPKDEILQLYREAKDKGKEIRILADMNCTTAKEMRGWLIDMDIKVPEDKRFKETTTPPKLFPEAEAAKTTSADSTEDNIIFKDNIPESIRRILNERRRHLIEQIQKMQAEVDDINDFIGDYRRKDKS